MRDDIQSLEPRQMLSAVAAHVVGSTLKVTGTPHNDAIVVSLKGKTLNVKANGTTQKLPAKGVTLIAVRGCGGKDKVRVDAPIAYRVNGGAIKTPLAVGQIPTTGTPTAGTNTYTSSAGTLTLGNPPAGLAGTPSSGPVIIGGSTIAVHAGTTSLGGNINLSLGSGTLNLSDPPTSGTTQTSAGISSLINPAIGVLSTPVSEPAITGCRIAVESGGIFNARHDVSGAINPVAGSEVDLGDGTFRMGGSVWTGSFNIVPSPARDIAGSGSGFVWRGSTSVNGAAGTYTSNPSGRSDDSGIIGFTFGGENAINSGTVTLHWNSSINTGGGMVVLSDRGIGDFFAATGILRLNPGLGLAVSYFDPACTVMFATLPAPDQAPQLILNGGESIYIDHPLAFTATLDPAATIAPGTYPIIRFADGAYMPDDISGMQFKSDTLPAQYTYTLALNAANRTIDLVIADKPASEPAVVDQPT